MDQRPRWLSGRVAGLCGVSALALSFGGACGGAGGDASKSDASAADASPKDAATKDAAGADALPSACESGASGEPAELRCTGLYSDWATKTLAPGVRQYDPGLHLWSDGANKTRWIYLPPGTKIDTTDMNQWMFPPGTKLWKEFVVGGAPLETRLIWKRPTGAWYFTVYRWSADGSSTTELTAGELDADGNGYEIPTQAACYDCHSGRLDAVLGFEAVALSTSQASGVTMATLIAGNLLTTPPSSPLTIPGDATSAAALGYLHMNCGVSCHNRDVGPAGYTNVLMRLDDTTLASVMTTDTWTTGMGVNANFPVVGLTNPKDFAPCNPGGSSAYYRMNHRDGVGGAPTGTQMPPKITHLVDTDGVALIAAWLDGLSQCSGATASP